MSHSVLLRQDFRRLGVKFEGREWGERQRGSARRVESLDLRFSITHLVGADAFYYESYAFRRLSCRRKVYRKFIDHKSWGACFQDVLSGFGYHLKAAVDVSCGLQGSVAYVCQPNGGIRDDRAGYVGYGSRDCCDLRWRLGVAEGRD